MMKENIPLTKVQMLQRQSTSIEKLCELYRNSTQKREALVDFKLQGNSEKQKRHRIANLKQAHALGVISDEEFKVCVKELLCVSELLPSKDPQGAISNFFSVLNFSVLQLISLSLSSY